MCGLSIPLFNIISRVSILRFELSRRCTGVRVGIARSCHYYRAAFRFLPAVNLTVLLALILISSPVLGFLPFLAFLFANEKVPKPTIVSLSSFLAALTTASAKDFIVVSAWVFEIPASFDNFSTSSALVMLFSYKGK